MNSKNPQELIDEVQQEQQTRSEVAKQVLQWFLDGNQQELFPRTEVVEQISEELDLSLERAQLGITDTVGDIVDPVQQVISKQKYVGIIDYKVFADEGAYGYVDYDDRRGKRKRVVCARCVERAQYDEEVAHATQGEGSSSEDASWQQLLNKITSHYANLHTKVPENIEPGASLVNGTTISGNTAFHQGNESLIDAGVSDHSELSGIGANDHHTPPDFAYNLVRNQDFSNGSFVSTSPPKQSLLIVEGNLDGDSDLGLRIDNDTTTNAHAYLDIDGNVPVGDRVDLALNPNSSSEYHFTVELTLTDAGTVIDVEGGYDYFGDAGIFREPEKAVYAGKMTSGVKFLGDWDSLTKVGVYER